MLKSRNIYPVKTSFRNEGKIFGETKPERICPQQSCTVRNAKGVQAEEKQCQIESQIYQDSKAK